MITSGNQTYLFGDGTAFIVCAVGGRCTCGRMSFLFTNVNGQTRCLWCAPTECDSTDDGPDVQAAFGRAVV